MRKVALLLLLAGIALPALAARRVTVAQLQQILDAAHGKPDAETARQLSELELTERLSQATLARCQSESPGPEARQALAMLADLSAFLELPPAEVPAKPPPDLAAQRALMAQTVNYVTKTIHQLPNFYATRVTTHFEDTPQGFDSTHMVFTFYEPLRSVGSTTATVLYRDGDEVLDQAPAPGKSKGRKKPEPQPIGLTTSGEFGPILATVLVDGAHGKLYWSHWEQGPEGPRAVFRYSVPQEQSHYQVGFCCVPGIEGNRVSQQNSGYHGEISVDPVDGTVLRLTIQADLKPNNRLVMAAIAVEYGPVQIGGKTYICPIKSVATSLGAGQEYHSPQVQNIRTATLPRQAPGSPGSMQTLLNDVVFEQYHLFRAESHLVVENDSDNAAPEKPSAMAPGAAAVPAAAAANSAAMDAPPAAAVATAEPPSPQPESAPTPLASAETVAPAATGAAPAFIRPSISAPGLPPSEITVAAATELPDTPAPSSPDAGFSLRVSARLVDVGVVVYDKKGHPITGLKADDFVIEDDGRRQTVRFLSQTGDTPAQLSTNAAGISPAQPAYSNRRAAATAGSASGIAAGNTTVLLIDAGNLAWNDLTNARGQLLHFLQGLPAGERVALYALQAHSFEVLEDATADHAALAAKLGQWMPNAQDLARSQQMEQRNRQQFEDVRSSNDLQSVNGNTSSSPDTAATVDPKLLANGSNPARDALPVLEAVARHLAAIPGHKNLVWISSDNVLADWADKAVGGDKGSKNIDGPVLRLQEALNDAHVSLYPLDASQPETQAVAADIGNMNVELAPGVTGAPRAQGGADKTGRLAAQMQQDMHPIRPAIQEMAAATGGRAFRRSGDIAASLDQAVADGRATYLLSFTPDSQADDKYHVLTVKLVGQHGATLHYRTGYQYTKEPVTLKDRVRQALSQPLDVSEIALSANPVSTPLGATLKLNIAANDLELKQQADRYIGKLDIFLVQREDLGSHARVSGQTIGLRLLPATYKEAIASGVPFDQLVEREQKTGSIRIVVIDENTGRIGSVTVPASAMQGKWH